MVDYDVVILGAGFAGIGMGLRLQAAGYGSFLILEAASDVGGTWRDNTYPGAGCDTESHLYSFSFAPNPGVSRVYAGQAEILGYAKRLVEDHDLARRISFDSEVQAAVWDDQRIVWHIRLATGRAITARYFVAAWGQLNRPSIPLIPGAASFEGTSFHSARWRHDIDLAGLRVASIGNAASAVQYIPEIAPMVEHLDVYQRSPNWVVPRMDRPYTSEERALYSGSDEAYRASRDALFAWRESLFLRMKQATPEARELEQIARDHLAAQVSDPKLRTILTPDYPLGCKRILRSDDYYPALMRDNVELITAPIVSIVRNGIVTADDMLHPVDVIIFGTGFETRSFQGPVEISGQAGLSLRECWRSGPRAFLGITIPSFPNLFLLYGPNTNLGHNSILTMLEAQFGYVLQAIELAAGGAIEVQERTAADFDATLQAEMENSAWAGNCVSWYKDASGRVVNNWSGTVAEYQSKTARLNAADYRIRRPYPDYSANGSG